MSGDRDTKHVAKPTGIAEAFPLASNPSKRFVRLRPADSAAGDVRGALSEAIRSIVLPRLVAARRANDMTLAHDGRAVTDRDVSAFLAHVVTADHHLAEAMLTVLRLRGASREEILLELFQPVARRLGEQWLGDECSFADVTLGVGRLQRLMRSDAMPAGRRTGHARSGRILVACLPGEQHTLGAAIVEDFFRSAGWETVIWSGPDEATLEVVARSAPFDLIGISIGDQRFLVGLGALVQRLRRASSRNLMGVIAGGRALAQGASAAAYGLDAIVHDARGAVPAARALLRTDQAGA
jgi:methanogenic corrinoid protein MtbC1